MLILFSYVHKKVIFEIFFHRLWTPYHCDKPWRNHTNSKKRSMQLNGCSWYHSSSIGIIRSTRPTGCSGSWERHHHGGTLSTSIIKTRELRRKSCFKCSNTLSYTRMFSYRTKLTPTNTSFQGEASFVEWRKEHGLKLHFCSIEWLTINVLILAWLTNIQWMWLPLLLIACGSSNAQICGHISHSRGSSHTTRPNVSC